MEGIGHRVCNSVMCQEELAASSGRLVASREVIGLNYDNFQALHPYWGPCTVAQWDAFAHGPNTDVITAFVMPDNISYPAAQARAVDLYKRHPGDDRYFVRPKLLRTQPLTACDFCSSRDTSLKRLLLCPWACIDSCGWCRERGRVDLCQALHTWTLPLTTYQDTNGDAWAVAEGEIAIRRKDRTFITLSRMVDVDAQAYISVREGEKLGSVVVCTTVTQARLHSIRAVARAPKRPAPDSETGPEPGSPPPH